MWEAQSGAQGRITGFCKRRRGDRPTIADVTPERTDQAYVETSMVYGKGVAAHTRAYQFAAMRVVFREERLCRSDRLLVRAQFRKQTRQSYIERASKARSDAGFLEAAGRHHIKTKNDAARPRVSAGPKDLQRSLRKTEPREIRSVRKSAFRRSISTVYGEHRIRAQNGSRAKICLRTPLKETVGEEVDLNGSGIRSLSVATRSCDHLGRRCGDWCR